MTRLRSLGILTTLLVVAAACSTNTIAAPTSDKNFDDPDDPKGGGGVGAVDATTAETNRDGSVPCATTKDCPTSFTCYFPVGGGCSAAGVCIVYELTGGCLVRTRCGCDGNVKRECSPEGYATVPTVGEGTCAGDSGGDAATDDASDGATE